MPHPAHSPAFPDPFDTLPGDIQVWLVTEVDAWLAEHRPRLDEDDEGT